MKKSDPNNNMKSAMKIGVGINARATPSLVGVGLLLLLSLSTAVNAQQQQVPSSVHAQQQQAGVGNVITNFQTDTWLYDENHKLKSFHLVYPLGCDSSSIVGFDMNKPWYGYQHHAVTGDALQTVFGPSFMNSNKEGKQCEFACLERGVDKSVAGHTMPYLKYSSNGDGQDFKSWYEGNCHKAEVCLINYYIKDEKLDIEWYNPRSNQHQAHNSIGYGERQTLCFDSYLGHRFRIKHGDNIVDEFTVEYNMAKAFGESPPSADSSRMSTKEKVVKQVEQTLQVEWNRQNKVKRTFSSLGFAKGKLPPDVFASMGSFYYNNRLNQVREEWGGKGVYVNWWESNVSFIQIPWALKGRWQIRLSDMVSEWAQVEVEQTVMYGLRQYEDGARLLSHVDRTATHAVSLIVNVAQGGLVQPWPVEVFDHAGRLHEVLMDPGDVVYYESAKNLHSRNRPLVGNGNAIYVNLFTHYRPKADGDKWFTVETPDDVPSPLMSDDIQGECRLETQWGATAQTPTGQLGVVQQVQCDDPRLGPYVSPTFFEVHGVKDLLEWWHRTSPDYVPEPEVVDDNAATVHGDASNGGGGNDEDGNAEL